ncbi:neutral zinc metallopeptidase [Streptomyces sp. SID13031]|uniref:neutral zinc metallopeptidase n=1 Tax=Streptomyces sp. SID13031 TaxID=2706046 RepID=UPI0013C67661|nr:neutral zinc metallopeptidase [Streptomyces sp. SID13031]NEA31698.1 hypothetical protein [Streptomyces sp. SID13031]
MAEESGPRPGHFLPNDEQPGYERPGVPAYGAPSEPLTAPTPRLGRGAETPDGPPLLSGSRLGPPPAGDRAAAAFKARYQPEPLAFEPKKRSKALIAAIVAGALIVIGGAVFAATKVLPSSGASSPAGTPSVTPTPSDSTAVIVPAPDALTVLRTNKLYTTGKLAPANCKEPAFRPTSKANIRRYYQTFMVCMNKAWEPVVRKTGNEFHPPKLVVVDKDQIGPCNVFVEYTVYCHKNGGSVALAWADLGKKYATNRPLTRIDMANALGYVYSVHVQNLMGIRDASFDEEDEAATAALKMEQSRRFSLQSTCLAAAFLGAAKAAFPVTGDLLTSWKWRSKNASDETTKDKVRNFGTAKSTELWMTRGFTTANPGSCNTYVAAAGEVS